MEKKEIKLEILKLEIEKLKLEIELEKLRHKEYWQPTITVTSADGAVSNPLETFS